MSLSLSYAAVMALYCINQWQLVGLRSGCAAKLNRTKKINLYSFTRLSFRPS